VGTVFLAAAIVLALYVVTNILFTSGLALLTAGAAVVVFGVLWYVLPMVGSSSSEDGEPSGDESSRDGEPQESRRASSRR
jgi:hypothetical protein